MKIFFKNICTDILPFMEGTYTSVTIIMFKEKLPLKFRTGKQREK